MWPAFSHSSRVEPGIRSCSLRLWPIEVSRSAVPQMIVVGTRPSTSTASNLSRPREAREEVGHHLERRLRQHPVDEVDVRRGHLVAEGEQVGGDAWRPTGPPGVRRRPACAAGQGPDGAAGQLATELGGEHRAAGSGRVEAAGGGRDEARRRRPGRRSARGAARRGRRSSCRPSSGRRARPARRARRGRGRSRGRGRAARWSRGPRSSGRSGRASAGRSRRRGPGRGRPRAGSASSRG